MKGITRYADVHMPMDEALTRVAIDISGRPFLVFKAEFARDKVGTFDTELVQEWFQAFAMNAGVTLHVETLYGTNDHHIAESCFKGLARALRAAVAIDPRAAGEMPSTKGTLGRLADSRPLRMAAAVGERDARLHSPRAAAAQMTTCRATPRASYSCATASTSGRSCCAVLDAAASAVAGADGYRRAGRRRSAGLLRRSASSGAAKSWSASCSPLLVGIEPRPCGAGSSPPRLEQCSASWSADDLEVAERRFFDGWVGAKRAAATPSPRRRRRRAGRDRSAGRPRRSSACFPTARRGR